MECLHGRPASSSTTKKGSFWFCGQKPSCGFICTEEDGFIFQKAIANWKNTEMEQPICEHLKPAKFRVVKDIMKENFGRPYFTCAEHNNPCSLWMWADEKKVDTPNCYHGKLSVMRKVKKEGPNKGRNFFCCSEETPCNYFQWGPERETTPQLPYLPHFYNGPQ